MHSTTPDRRTPSEGADRLDDLPAFLAEHWTAVLRQLPADLDVQARVTGAFTRVRGIACPSDLLRLILAYAVAPQWSFRLLGAWGVLAEVADLSHVALQRRMRHARPWLAWLLHALLDLPPAHVPPGWRLRLVDATVVSKPGSTGTDWRLHLNVDLDQAAIVDVQLTDAKGAESLTRVVAPPHDILITDRGYAYASSYAPHLRTTQPLIGRANWQNMPLYQRDGTRLDVIAWLKQRGRRKILAMDVDLEVAQGERYPMRLIAGVLPTAQAEAARTKLKKRKPHAVKATLYAAGFVLLLTTLPEAWSAPQLLELYRLRWQIELRIKRLKSLFGLDDLRVKQAELAQSVLLAKLIAAILVERMTGRWAALAAPWWVAEDRPVSCWRVEQWAWAVLQRQVLGVRYLCQWEAHLDRLRRYFCDPPRKRHQQLATARAMLARLNAGAGVA